jgi:hypothetical protein
MYSSHYCPSCETVAIANGGGDGGGDGRRTQQGTKRKSACLGGVGETGDINMQDGEVQVDL